VEKAIAKLSCPFREVILLRYYSGMSCPGIARSLGKPLGTVTKTLSRAYGMLREALREET
jgi:DNA-directed RNA polymerase specialized sigma24 family protein